MDCQKLVVNDCVYFLLTISLCLMDDGEGRWREMDCRRKFEAAHLGFYKIKVRPRTMA